MWKVYDNLSLQRQTWNLVCGWGIIYRHQDNSCDWTDVMKTTDGEVITFPSTDSIKNLSSIDPLYKYIASLVIKHWLSCLVKLVSIFLLSLWTATWEWDLCKQRTQICRQLTKLNLPFHNSILKFDIPARNCKQGRNTCIHAGLWYLNALKGKAHEITPTTKFKAFHKSSFLTIALIKSFTK